MFVQRGDIVLVDFDSARDFEAAKKRPAIVVSNDISNKYAHVVIVVPLSTNLDRIYPHELVLETHKVNLEQDCKTQVHLIRHVSKLRLSRVIAHLSDDIMAELDALLREQLGL